MPRVHQQVDDDGNLRPNNRKYSEEWRRFTEWADANGYPSSPYLRRDTVDAYFDLVVSQTRAHISTASARGIVTALQWYSTNVEHRHAEIPFVVNNSSRSRVAQSLYTRDLAYVYYM